MAINWQTFRIRTISSFIFMAVMIVGLSWSDWSYALLFTIIHFGCWWEYFKLIEKIDDTKFHINAKLGWMLLGFGIFLQGWGSELRIGEYTVRDNFSLPVSIAGFLLVVIGIFRQQKVSIRAYARAGTGIIYISLALAAMIDLYRATEISFFHTAFIFSKGTIAWVVIGTLWINDSMAYVVGSLIGKHSLTPISPKKTWEGTIGGFILAIIAVALLLPLILFKKLDSSMMPTMILFGTIAAVAAISGTFGDLFESKLKRMAGVKDSGQILPGHGGFLDRFDSLLFAGPSVWILLKIAGYV